MQKVRNLHQFHVGFLVAMHLVPRLNVALSDWQRHHRWMKRAKRRPDCFPVLVRAHLLFPKTKKNRTVASSRIGQNQVDPTAGFKGAPTNLSIRYLGRGFSLRKTFVGLKGSTCGLPMSRTRKIPLSSFAVIEVRASFVGGGSPCALNCLVVTFGVARVNTHPLRFGKTNIFTLVDLPRRHESNCCSSAVFSGGSCLCAC